MEIKVDRKFKKSNYTIGKLYINGQYFCDTIEDTDRGLKQGMSEEKIKSVKVAAKTAIPSGTYIIRMDIISPKYSLKPWYVQNCHGAKMPRFQDVPGFSGVLIHPGNTEKDSAGCLLVGKNDVKGMVTDSKNIFLKLYNRMWDAYKRGEVIYIIIE